MKAKILLAGQKGGVGKSAIVRALAVATAQAGHSVCIVDYDGAQHTVTEWCEVRKLNKFKPTIKALAPDDTAVAKVQIMDSPGWTSDHTLMLANYADLVILPTGPSTADDLTPTLNLAFELEENGVPGDRILIVLNRIHNNDQAARARAFATDAELTVASGEIRESAHAASLHDVGLTVLDIKTERDRARAEQCIAGIVDWIEALGPRADREMPKTLEIDL